MLQYFEQIMRASGRYKWTVNGDILELVASCTLNQGWVWQRRELARALDTSSKILQGHPSWPCAPWRTGVELWLVLKMCQQALYSLSSHYEAPGDGKALQRTSAIARTTLSLSRSQKNIKNKINSVEVKTTLIKFFIIFFLIEIYTINYRKTESHHK